MLSGNLYQKPLGVRQMALEGYMVLAAPFQSPENICRSRNFVNLLVPVFKGIFIFITDEFLVSARKFIVIDAMDMPRTY